MRFLEFFYTTLLFTLVGILSNELTAGLRDVRVRVPHAVRRGEKAVLKCIYNIEDDTLYSVKWYKGRREFYRYTPKETPPMKVFHFQGVKIKRIASNESQVVLDAVTMATSGKYSCEVSADAPSFHTLISTADLEVIETPHNTPFITGIRPRYRVGDILRGNCTSRHSKPAANLTWTVNNEEVNPAHVRHHKIIRDVRTEMETAIVGIHFVVTDQHFDNGKLKLRCNAQIHDVYWKTTEKTILEADQFTKYGSSVNMVNPDELYDQYSFQEGEMLHNKKNSYLTQLQGEEDDGGEDGAAWRGARSNAANHAKHLPRVLTLLLLLSWACKQLVQQQQQQLMPSSASSSPGETATATATATAKAMQQRKQQQRHRQSPKGNNNNNNKNNNNENDNKNNNNCNNASSSQRQSCCCRCRCRCRCSCFSCCSLATRIADGRALCWQLSAIKCNNGGCRLSSYRGSSNNNHCDNNSNNNSSRQLTLQT